MHLPTDDFWGLTLAEFSLLAEHHNQRMERELLIGDQHAALICWIIAAVNGNKKMTPQDFMPKQTIKSAPTEKMTDQQIMGIFKAISGSGGK